MSKKAIIVDGNNRAWAAFHAYSRLSFNGESVSMIYGMPQMIKTLITMLGTKRIFIVWDGRNRSKRRMKLHPGYKGDRKHKGLVDFENWLDQQKVVKRAFNYLGIPQIEHEDCEADDVIAKLVRVLKRKGYDDITIVSGDKDFHQLISRYVKVYSESRKKLIDTWNCKEEFGYHPYQTVDYLTLVGDDSDKIDGYPGIGEKRAKDLLEKYDSIEKFLDSTDTHNIINKKQLHALRNRNQQLMDLYYYLDTYPDDVKIEFIYGSKPEPNKKKFLRLAAKYNMKKSMSSNFIDNF